MRKKHIVGIVLICLVLVAVFLLPVPPGLSEAGRNTVALTLILLILLLVEIIPSALSCLIVLALMPIFGTVPKFADALVGFSNPVVFFIIASFGISSAFIAVPLTSRILAKLLSLFGKDVKTMLLAMMCCTAVVSSLISNIPTTAIFMTIGLSFLNMFDDEQKRMRTGRAFMIAIPVASMIGGMITPAGSSLNLLAINLLGELTGAHIAFVQWMAVGLPLCAVMLPLAWLIIVKVYKPAEVEHCKLEAMISSFDIPKKMGRKEISVIVITLGLLALWILSSWIRAIDVYVVALLGCCLFIMPGIEVITWKEFTRSIKLDVIFITGAVLSIGSALIKNGVSDYLVDMLNASAFAVGINGFVAIIATAVFVLLMVIPVAPALITMLAGPLAAFALAQGYPVSMAFIALALCASNCYLLPIDSVPLLTYGTGYYKMTDMPKSTALIQLCMIGILALWLPIIAPLVGLG